MTLKFLGEVPQTRLDDVEEVLTDVVRKAASFATGLTLPGVFPGEKRPRILWMGLSDDTHGFRNLAGRLDRKFEKAGFPGEGRPFRPHLTLARFREPWMTPHRGQPGAGGEVGQFLFSLGKAQIDRSAFTVAQIVLLRSRLSPGGAVYQERLRLPLN